MIVNLAFIIADSMIVIFLLIIAMPFIVLCAHVFGGSIKVLIETFSIRKN
jgi:hypothetical protein